jgi:hypothetical protein
MGRMDADGLQAIQTAAVGQRHIEEHKVDVPGGQPVKAGKQGLRPMDLKLRGADRRKRFFDKLRVAGVIFDE